jgi:hypothetical protein
MNKFYSLAFAGLLAGAVSAQTSVNSVVQPSKPKPTAVAQFDKAKFASKFSNPQANSAGSYWVNYGTVIDQVLGGGPGMVGPATININYMNQDSLMVGDFGGTYSAIWIHHLGDILDIKSPYYTQILGTAWDATTTYSVDSASMVYLYQRNPNITTDDTLIFTFYQNNPVANISSSGFIGTTAANYGTDTVSVKLMKYTYTTNKPNATSTVVVKVPLTAADTSWTFYGEKFFALPSPYVVGANKLMACAVTFKPGYSYVLGDTMDMKNSFYFASYEENGDGGGTGTFPSYTDCNYQSAACDYSSSGIVPIDVRYNQAGGWNGYFIPSYAYTVGYAFEHHLISYRVTDPAVTTGMNQLGTSGFVLEQNVPNPFTGTSTINFTLHTQANSVTFDVVDFAGRTVISQTDKNLKADDYTYTVDGANLAKGIYFYSINVDGYRVTKKMIVD